METPLVVICQIPQLTVAIPRLYNGNHNAPPGPAAIASSTEQVVGYALKETETICCAFAVSRRAVSRKRGASASLVAYLVARNKLIRPPRGRRRRNRWLDREPTF